MYANRTVYHAATLGWKQPQPRSAWLSQLLHRQRRHVATVRGMDIIKPAGMASAARPPVAIPSRGVDYRKAVVLAPMVRSGELPSRLCALKYGADLVWGMFLASPRIWLHPADHFQAPRPSTVP